MISEQEWNSANGRVARAFADKILFPSKQTRVEIGQRIYGEIMQPFLWTIAAMARRNQEQREEIVRLTELLMQADAPSAGAGE